MAATCLKCLAPDDLAVRSAGLPSADVSDAVRAWRFTVATALGFAVSNVFCWIMNRRFVFRPGKYPWYAEFGMFFAAAGFATLVALGVSSALIGIFGLMTSVAVIFEVLISFLVNFFVRKFVIFRR